MGGIDLLAGKPNVITQPGQFLGHGLARISGEEPGDSQQDSTPSRFETFRCVPPVSPQIQAGNTLILEADDDEELILGDFLKLDAQDIRATARHHCRSPHRKT
ncbi:hypothetical protein [Methylobacterium sp. 174MFSha1.1]|uniref:hypothetical protein n=1 Tax=Methylobacterium sp. 174MFSha1.1 TaxID=1502749 RepID=UPI0011603AF4|nr:hypothetical protein [Methylobacterium sp. 174MFSha1.1]